MTTGRPEDDDATTAGSVPRGATSRGRADGPDDVPPAPAGPDDEPVADGPVNSA